MHSSYHYNHHSSNQQHQQLQLQHQHCIGGGVLVTTPTTTNNNNHNHHFEAIRMMQQQQQQSKKGRGSLKKQSLPFIQAKKDDNGSSSTSSNVVKYPSSSPLRSRTSSSPPNMKSNRDTPTATIDDFDIMLLHEDFPHLLTIATKVKGTHQKVTQILCSQQQKQEKEAVEGENGHPSTTATNTYHPSIPIPYRPKNALLPEEVLLAVERMQEVLLHKKPSDTTVILRGRYPITDSLMEDAMIALHEEYEHGQEWLKQYNNHQQQHQITSVTNGASSSPSRSSKQSSSSSPSSDDKVASNPNKRERGESSFVTGTPNSHMTSSTSIGGTGGPITIKYAKWQTDILMSWMIDNKNQPFPDADAIEFLTQQTGLSSSQIVNWTTNVRKRNRKATCENGKKPHHFLDFLFLVHDREMKKKKGCGKSISLNNETGEVVKQHVSKVKYGESPPRMRSQTSTNRNYRSADFSDLSGFVPSAGLRSLERQPMIQPSPTKSGDVEMDNTTNVFMQYEPIPYTAPSNDSILIDFANSWLTKRRHDRDVGTMYALDRDSTSFFDRDDINHNNILPSVTDDSHEDDIGNFIQSENQYVDDDLSISFASMFDNGNDNMLIEDECEWITPKGLTDVIFFS